MEYVINPMWFYWLQISGGLHVLLLVGGIFALIGGVVIVWIAVDNPFYNEEETHKMRKISARAISCGIICILVSTAIPTSETLIKMQIAKFGTKDNVETVLQTINDKTDKLIEAIGKDK